MGDQRLNQKVKGGRIIMEMDLYQKEALKTDKMLATGGVDLIVSLLGLAGETGELLSEYKKYLRDGESHKLFKERIQEELGDILWYLTNVASKFSISLDDIARANILKCRSRWQESDQRQIGLTFIQSFDESFPDHERFQRKMEIKITDTIEEAKDKMRAFVDGVQAGNDLTDNSYHDDGYRFHDVFHYAYVAVLGWSPVIRSLQRLKRKSVPHVDEVEDGGRAIAIEEGISAMVFSYASQHHFLEDISELDYDLLRTIKLMTQGLEVSRCSFSDWERAILVGFEAWRLVKAQKGGKLIVDLNAQTLSFC